MEDEDVDDLMEEHADTQRTADRMLNILHEQNKTQAANTEVLRSIDEKVGKRAQAKNRIIYALLALLAGVLYAVGFFEPVELPFLAVIL